MSSVDRSIDERSFAERLGAFIAQTRLIDVPGVVRERATISLVHNVAMLLAGRARETVGQSMAKRYWYAPREATLLHDGTRVSVEGAAFANGALMHVRSQDDTHAPSTSHPGTPVIAAALSVAEACGSSGPNFLLSVILGYEVLCRIGRDFDEQISQRGFRVAAVFGAFGAAAASAKLLDLAPAQASHALALAAHFGGGLAQVWEEGSAEYPLQLGFAARNGILAARAASAGATAARWALEGKSGFYRAYADTVDEASEIVSGLGESWQLSDVTVKPYPVCAILQGPVGSMISLARNNELPAESVKSVALYLNPFEAHYPGIDNPGPFASTTAAKMSAQFSLAVAALEHRLALDDLARLSEPRIADFATRVRVIGDPAVAARLSRLQIVTHDGRVLTADVTAPAGQPSLAEISQFARTLSPEVGVPAAAMDKIVDEIRSLENSPTLKPLLDAITVQAPVRATRPTRRQPSRG
jgi:2-methylcitrate dehydratase PrpD